MTAIMQVAPVVYYNLIPTDGQPIFFSVGQFAGQTIRGELEEIQSPQSAMKYTPGIPASHSLDPLPVVLLRLFVLTNGQESEIEDYSLIDPSGLVCLVNLVAYDLSRGPLDILPNDQHARRAIAQSSDTVVHPRLIEWDGRARLMCIFPNLAITETGTFQLHYCIFNMCVPIPVGYLGHQTIAEICGETFSVSEEDFIPATEAVAGLSAVLAAYGIFQSR